jgi:signal transduction histidine kinase
MSKRKKTPARFEELQKRAEEHLAMRQEPDCDLSDSNADLRRLVHELDVHRIELEMQQEELLKSRAELEESLSRYMELYDFAPIGYLSIDQDCRILQLNLTASKLIGIDRSKLVGQRFDRYVAFDDQPIFSNMLSSLFSLKRPQACEIGIECHGWESPGAAVATGSNSFHSKLITVRIDAVVCNDQSQCRMALTDISEQKQIQCENDVLQATMAQVRKMESIGRLAGGVAHDYNNMLQVMLGNIELIMLRDPARPVDQEKLADLRHCVVKAANLTHQLLAFARNQPYKPQLLDFSLTIEDMLKMLICLVGENITINYTPPCERLMVKMDPSQIDQILANLIVNARDAILGSGTICITLSGVTVDKENQGIYPDIPGGSYVRLCVSDNGRGMDSSTLENVFEPFFTTKSVAEGTGLGLATVYGIVKQNGGSVNVSSVIGKGTIFDVYLPRYADEVSLP